MSFMISIDYPSISAKDGETIKATLQQQDILGDFGPGPTLWQHLFGRPKPDMTWCNISEPEWFVSSVEDQNGSAELTEKAREQLNTAIMEIYKISGGPITVTCQIPGQKPRAQKDLNINEFKAMLDETGLPLRTLIVLDRRIDERGD